MYIYAVILTEPDMAAWERVREGWPGEHLILTDRIAFVREQAVTTTHDVADKVGMNREGNVNGFVLDTAYIAGWTSSRLSEWMDKISDRSRRQSM